ncbi:hypothetical protein HN018_21905 (plasmid) [Lichenicola cladoniae]|uniref:Transposase TnpC homeodomain domain-containing protein n=1 Tax=Lichenicola cladoniae TaxID=1484109 RepID=A0A6M8HXA0_9PROT|nr:hypothetical protein [Acetobacteraceae bacterium]QKE92886.1 hypothetical protein HN018_21905 [Lichenicola cladoniae]
MRLPQWQPLRQLRCCTSRSSATGVVQRDRFGSTSERSRRLLDQLELQLEKLEGNAAEADVEPAPPGDLRPGSSRTKPVCGPLPAHLPRERVVVPGPTVCPCCSGRLVKLG